MALSTLNSPATSIEFWCFDTVFRLIRHMADVDTFRAVGDEIVPAVQPEAVIRRYNRRPSRDESRRSGERAINVPGFVVTYLGHRRPVNAGDNDVDDGMLRILVQLVDDGDDQDSPRAASYFAWMKDLRERLQETPTTRLSPLEDCPIELGQVYLVHVEDFNPPDETDWGFKEQMRMALMCTCYTRTDR
jgi:hypothetical protein